MSITRPALRYHGGKFRLWQQFLKDLFPPHEIYTEAFGGAAGCLLQKDRARAEVYNDLDADVSNFFALLRDAATRARLVEVVALTPYARREFDLAWEWSDDPIERARRLCVRAGMGFGSAGATKGTTGFRTDTKRRYTTAQMDWATYPDAVAAAGLRFSGVLVENLPAIDVLLQHDTPDTLHFVDPPYLHDTRVMRARGGYRHELSDTQHQNLLQVLRSLQGMVIVCGYPSELYSEALADWTAHSTEARISAGRGTALRTEVAWLNPACAAALERSCGGLFAEGCHA